jgi:hypothetical protein
VALDGTDLSPYLPHEDRLVRLGAEPAL